MPPARAERVRPVARMVGRGLAQPAVAPSVRGQMLGAASGRGQVDAEAWERPAASACPAVRPGGRQEGTEVDPGAASHRAAADLGAAAAPARAGESSAEASRAAGASPAGAEVGPAGAEVGPAGAEVGPAAATTPADPVTPLGFGPAPGPGATPWVGSAQAPGSAWDPGFGSARDLGSAQAPGSAWDPGWTRDPGWAPAPGWAPNLGWAPAPGWAPARWPACARLRSWQSQCRFEATGVEIRSDDRPTQQIVVEQSAGQRLDVVRCHGPQGLDHLVHRHHSVVHRLLATQE